MNWRCPNHPNGKTKQWPDGGITCSGEKLPDGSWCKQRMPKGWTHAQQYAQPAPVVAVAPNGVAPAVEAEVVAAALWEIAAQLSNVADAIRAHGKADADLKF